MAVLTVQNMTASGLELTTTAAAALGDSFANNGRTFFYVNNGSGSDITVTINSQEECNQGFDHNIAVTVTAGEARYIGVFNTKRFNNATGAVEVTYSDVTTVTVAAVSS